MPRKDAIPKIIGTWHLLDLLGSGYSGSIFRAHHIHTGELVALKVQAVDHECPTNQYEKYIYPMLQGGKGVPLLCASGVHGKWNYLAIDLLGPSLDKLYKSNGKDNMDLRSVCCIAMQLIERLEFIHNRGVLHRDIQLGNCTIGLPPDEKTIYMIDFGFGKRYLDPRTHRHIPDSKAKRDFIGNYWFSSVGVHCRGKVPSRRDDMEALALMLIHLMTPRGLSWTRNGVPKTDEAHERLKREKKDARPEDLCRDLPPEFEEFLRYCRRLKFYDKPDYEHWIEEFRMLAVGSGFPEDDDFFWPPPSPIPDKTKPMTKSMEPDAVLAVLENLKNLNLDTRLIQDAKRQAGAAPVDSDGSTDVESRNDQSVVEISSGSDEESAPHQPVIPKRVRLIKLTKRAGAATDNNELSKLVLEFIQVLQVNSSRTLTKEAFEFLDALHKQLSDPSVFIMPLRASRSRSSNTSAESGHANIKLGTLARLRRDVRTVANNRGLAGMVAEFSKVTEKSGRTITKDGFAFLEGLGERLRQLEM